jgi:hypothetical protein
VADIGHVEGGAEQVVAGEAGPLRVREPFEQQPELVAGHRSVDRAAGGLADDLGRERGEVGALLSGAGLPGVERLGGGGFVLRASGGEGGVLGHLVPHRRGWRGAVAVLVGGRELVDLGGDGAAA